MIRTEKYSSLAASGLRTRYFPKNRIGQGLISLAPWLNLLLLLLFFVVIDRRFVLQPGIIVDLPAASSVVDQGSAFDITAVVLSIKSTEAGEREELIFFDDVRYRLTRDEQRKLRYALASKAKPGQGVTLVIQADRKVSHGTVVDLMNMALAAGIDRVNMAARL